MPERQGRAPLFLLFSFCCVALGCRATQSSADEPRPDSRVVASEPRPYITEHDEPLVIASWNLEWLYEEAGKGPAQRSPDAFTRLAKYAKRLDADVIAVQEVESKRALARVFDPTRYTFHVTSDTSTQRTGFVVDKRLSVRVHADYTLLAQGGLRSGADIELLWNGTWIRMLSVHLKSGCFDKPLTHDGACIKLNAQVPILESWMDARAAQGAPFVVLGDFNRRLFASEKDGMWLDLDDGEPPESDLFSPTQGQVSRCWQGQHPKFIDHIVLSRSLHSTFAAGAFWELLYDDDDKPYRRDLSDHCPIAVRLEANRPEPTRHVSHDEKVEPPTRPTNDSPLASSASADVTPRTSKPEQPSALPVKGNHSRKGNRYYHTSDCPQYGRVKIDTDKGEQLFSDEASARAAGYERSPDCPRR